MAKKFWSNTNRVSEVPNLNPDAYLPKSVNNTLTVVDCYDVPNSEKQTMNNAINSAILSNPINKF